MKEWMLAILRWSDKWRDSKTDIPGSAYYFISTSESFENDHGQELVFFDNDDTDDDDTPRPVLRLNGGKATYEKLPPKAYINIDPNYTGSRLMTIEQYDKTSKKLDKAVVIEQVIKDAGYVKKD